MEVTIEQAYAEACRALGEMLVQQRLIAKAQHEQAAQDPAENPS